MSEADITGLIKWLLSLWTIIGYFISQFVVDTNSYAM